MKHIRERNRNRFNESVTVIDQPIILWADDRGANKAQKDEAGDSNRATIREPGACLLTKRGTNLLNRPRRNTITSNKERKQIEMREGREGGEDGTEGRWRWTG